MYIAICSGVAGVGETLEKAFDELEEGYGNYVNEEETKFYEAKEIQVVRKFEVVSE